MTTFFTYQPQPNAPYQFQPTLDGQQYSAIVPWSLFGRRLYFMLYDSNGGRVLTRALVGSLGASPIQSLSWAGGSAVATFAQGHGYKPLSTVEVKVSGCAPVAYNGRFQAYVMNPLQFAYDVAVNPGAPTTLGQASYDIDLVKGYFEESTLVFREASGQFEVDP